VNKELTKRLVERFPVIYQDFYSPMSVTCMCWGFDHGDGWNDLVWQLSLAIEEELGYTPVQKMWFLFKKRFAVKWNALIYKLSPVRQRQYKFEGSGKSGDPIRRIETHYDPPPWDEKIVQFLFGKMAKVGRFECERMALKKLRFDPNTGFAVQQVKEKFGTLKYYCGGNDRINNFVNMAERLSAVTCEYCGNYGKPRSGGWIRTLCDKCDKDHNSGR